MFLLLQICLQTVLFRFSCQKDTLFPIQYNLNIFLKDEVGVIPCLPYRDELTEGYNVTPNFFISAEIPNASRSYATDNLKHRVGEDKRSRQIHNRLFDRDTLWLSHYDLNFLFVLSVYASGSMYAKTAFKEKARKLFRENIIDVLVDNYDFYEIVKNKFLFDFLFYFLYLYEYF